MTFAIVLVAVTVGWLLPVLGVSLVLFVVGDAIAGRSPGAACNEAR
ncbi:MAG: hypothetical protein ACXWYP_10680 [Pseudonocardia sp.]